MYVAPYKVKFGSRNVVFLRHIISRPIKIMITKMENARECEEMRGDTREYEGNIVFDRSMTR
jgi:hypothetical protein